MDTRGRNATIWLLSTLCIFSCLSAFGGIFSSYVPEDIPPAPWVVHQPLNDFGCGDRFYLCQDEKRRIFHVCDDNQTFGIAVNTQYGHIELYRDREMLWKNQFDSLYDHQGTRIAHAQIEGETLIQIFGTGDAPLFIFEHEEEGRYRFRDPTDGALLAAAESTWVVTDTFLWIPHRYALNWAVTVTNPERLRAKNIPTLFLVFALLKQTQNYMPGERERPYIPSLHQN